MVTHPPMLREPLRALPRVRGPTLAAMPGGSS